MAIPLILKIEVDDRGKVNVEKVKNSFANLRKETEKADKKVKTFSHTMGTFKGVLGGTTKAIFSLKGALAALGIGYLAKSSIDVAAGFERVKVALDTITKGKGVETFEALNKWAKIMPINTEKAIEAFQMMLAMGLRPSIKDMTTLVDTTAALGGSPEIMESIAFALGKIQAKGKASARELLTFSQRGIPIVEILREELNDTSIAFDNMGRSSYTANQVISAVLSGLEKRYGGLSEKISYTWVGLMEFFESEWKDFVRIIFESGLFDYIKDHLVSLRKRIEELGASGKLKEWAQNTSTVIVNAFKKIGEGIKFIIEHIDDLKKGFNLLLIPIKIFIVFKLAAILTEIGNGALIAAKHIIHLRASMELLNKKISKLSIGTKGGLIGLALFGGWEIGTWLRNKFDIVNQFGVSLAAGLHKTFVKLQYALADIWDLIKYSFNLTIKFIENALNGLPKSMEFILNSIIRGINSLLDSMSNLPLIGEKVKGMKLGEIEFGKIKLKEDYIEWDDLMKTSLERDKEKAKVLKDIENIYIEIFNEIGKVEEKVKSTKEETEKTVKSAVELPKSLQKTTQEISKMEQAWNNLWKKMNDSFVNGFADMLAGNIRKFSDFMKNIKTIFLAGIGKMIGETMIRPMIEPLTTGLKGAMSGFMGKAVGGIGGQSETGFLGTMGSKISPFVAAGGLAYGATSLMGATRESQTLAPVGAMIGMLGGPVGAAIGGGIGAIIGDIFGDAREKLPPVPEINLVYDIINGDIERVSETWKATDRSKELLNAIDSVFQDQINFYNGVGTLVGERLSDIELAISGKGQAINLEGLTGKAFMQMALTQFETYEKAFGSEMADEFREKLEDLYSVLMSAAYTITPEQVEKLLYQPFANILELDPSERAIKFAEFMETMEREMLRAHLYKGGPEPTGFIAAQFEEWEKWLGGFQEKFTGQFQPTIAQAIGEGFLESVESHDFQTFRELTAKSLKESLKKGILESLTTQFYEKAAFNLWGSLSGMFNLDEMLRKMASGDFTDIDTFVNSFNTLNDSIDKMEPVWTQFNGFVENLSEKLGLNTEAIIENNDLLEKQQQIEDFISELTIGQLAPVQSFEAIMGRYNELLSSDNLSELFNFVSGTALPFLQTYGGNYQEAFSGIIEDLRNLSGLYGANLSPSAIGEAVAGAIVPAIQSGSQTINVKIEVDGREIGEVMLNQLQTNPSLVQEIREIVQ